MLGEEIDVQEASEPTDIIWENRHFTPRQRNIKRVIVWSVIVFMLFISFCIIFTCKKSGDELKNRYNKKDCADYNYFTEGGLGKKIANATAYKSWYKIAKEENSFIRE